MKRFAPVVLIPCLLLLLAGCGGEQSKIDGVKNTVIPDCNGKTMQALVGELLETPAWGFEKTAEGKQFVTVNGTLAGDKLPTWVKEQNLMNIRFRFGLDPKTEKYNPDELGGFPSLSSPEGVLQAYKALTCK